MICMSFGPTPLRLKHKVLRSIRMYYNKLLVFRLNYSTEVGRLFGMFIYACFCMKKKQECTIC